MHKITLTSLKNGPLFCKLHKPVFWEYSHFDLLHIALLDRSTSIAIDKLRLNRPILRFNSRSWFRLA